MPVVRGTEEVEEAVTIGEVETRRMSKQIFENEFEDFRHLAELEKEAEELAEKVAEYKEKVRKDPYFGFLRPFYRKRKIKYNNKKRELERNNCYVGLRLENARELLEDSLYVEVETNRTPLDDPIEGIDEIYEMLEEREKATKQQTQEETPLRVLLHNDYSPEELDEYPVEVIRDEHESVEWEENALKRNEFHSLVFYEPHVLDDPDGFVEDEFGTSTMVLYQFRGYEGECEEENMVFDIRGIVPANSVIDPYASAGLGSYAKFY